MRADLKRLPAWLQYGIALIVVAGVATRAWKNSGGRPAPGWILHILIPIVGWCYIAFGAWWVIDKFRKRRQPR